MPDTLEELQTQVRSLSPEERAKLADFLLDSLRDAPLAEIEQAWEREIEERVSAFERGELHTLSAESVFAEARRLEFLAEVVYYSEAQAGLGTRFSTAV